MKRKVIVPEPEEPNYDLDLAPMLAMMVALIPILLLSTVFVRVKIIESPLPQVIQQAIEQDNKNGERKVEVSLLANLKSGFTIVVENNGKKSRSKVSLKSGELNLEALKDGLVKVKKRYPTSFKLKFKPSKELNYKQIVQIMDAVRDTGRDGEKFTIKNETTQETATTNLLFPNVVFGNVMEG